MRKRITHLFSFFCFLLWTHCVFAQQVTISGKVTGDKDETLPGVSVVVKGTNIGTVTDPNGKYSIAVPSDAKTLTFSSIGMVTEEIAIGGRSQIDVQLLPDITSLNEVVVIGYGAVKKTDVTSSISSISEKDIKTLPVAGIDQALQGKVAGVTINSNGGQPGGGVTVNVRGITSVNGNQPLYVVDGVILDGGVQDNRKSVSQDQLGGMAGQTVQSPLAAINMNDIESVDILKDASAQAIYGARAANGVVLIKTKSGKIGESKVTYDVYYGVQYRPKKLKLLNLREFAEYQNSLIPEIRAVGSGGVLDTLPEFRDPSVLGTGTDWQDEIFQHGAVQNHQISFSGGQNKTNYYFSFNYFNQSGTVIGSNFERFSSKLGIDHQVKSWLKAGVNLNVSRANQRTTLTDGTDAVITLAAYNSPAAPVRGVDGQFASVTNIGGLSFGNPTNPVAMATMRKVRSLQYKGFGSIYADINFLKSFTLRNELNYDFNLSQNSAFQPKVENTTTGATILSPSKLIEDRGIGFFWALKSYLTFDKSFGNHYVNAVVGHEANLSTYDQITVSRQELANNLESVNAGEAENQTINGGKYATAIESYFARAVYTYNGRYSVTGSIRRDGSSNFGPQNKWGTFSAVSAGWTISEEEFLRKLSLINYLKIRAGIGSVGNSNTANTNNAYATNVSLIPVTPFGSGAQNFNIGNPKLQWESVVTKNIGVDATLFNRVVELTVDVYQKVSTKMLIKAKLPVYSGLNSANTYNPIQPPVTNAGKMTNTGVDISITTNNIQKSDLTWKTTVVFTHYKNILNDNGGVPNPAYREYGNAVQVTNSPSGQAVGSFYGLKSDGLFRSQAELDAFGTQNTNNQLAVGPKGVWLGDIRFKDINNDGVIDTRDLTNIGSPIPNFTYGITNTVTYKNFDLTVFLSGSQGAKILNYTRRTIEGLYNANLNQSVDVLNRYTPENPNATIPRYNEWNDQNRRMSDRYVENGSYLRIQNVTLAYNLPASIIKKIGVSSARVYFSGQNLKTFTKYTGYDPEIGAFNGNVFNMNIDDGHYPNPRTFTIGGNFVF
ncbi:TonB-dependent receptor [Cytophagaceae bacterium DM2B3-1]|uniref:TonB-dependent receptor n=1 Tax=Xanthocytophaga flava TaxID=3048013 RepID=A0ABT7D1L0_9BACT|nr:TonB-dependent receptor [Xanthocytophaga flavus]MDJ1498669.1 TonB-dependent receptor [Xanthocytophaga flavus]